MVIFNYTVNYIDVALCALLLMFIIIGYCRGLFVNVVNFIRWALGLFLSFYLSEKLNYLVYSTYVKPRALESINKTIVTSTNLDEVLKNLQDVANELPKFIRNSVDFSTLNVNQSDIASAILENYFEGILLTLVKAAIFICVFLLFFLITGIILAIARGSAKRKRASNGGKSPLKTTDRILGALLGVLKGAVVVFAVSSILVFVLDLQDETENLSNFMKEVNSSQLLKLIDEINPFNAITGGLL